MPDYSNGKVYKIVCNETGLIYVGSTCEPTLARRLAKHVACYKHWMKNKLSFITSFTILENNNYDIILLENSPCESKDQLHARERHYIEALECVNKVIPSRTWKETYDNYYINNKEHYQNYRVENKEKINEAGREYYKNNKMKVKTLLKAYADTHKLEKSEYDRKRRETKGKITCICGSHYSGSNKSDHEKTNKHKKYIESQEG